MAILVDPAVWMWRGRRWAHLVSDTGYEELHDFAGRLGIPRRAFQGDHYDVPSEYRVAALELGAEAVESRELVRRLRRSGLRLSPAERRQFTREVAARARVERGVGPIGEVDADPVEETGKDR